MVDVAVESRNRSESDEDADENVEGMASLEGMRGVAVSSPIITSFSASSPLVEAVSSRSSRHEPVNLSPDTFPLSIVVLSLLTMG